MVANFFAASRGSDASSTDNEGEDEDPCRTPEQDDETISTASSFLEDYAFLYLDPDTCDTNEIYQSAFMLQTLGTAHLNAIVGFIDVPELNICTLAVGNMEGVIAASAAAVSLF